MNKKFNLLKLLKNTPLSVLLIGVTGMASANNFYAAVNGAQQGVSVRTLKLQQVSFFATPFPVNGIAAGPNNDVYLVSGNHIYNYTVAGVLIKNMTNADANINYTDISIMGDRVYTSYSGSKRGVSVRDLALVSVSSFSAPFNIKAIVAGVNNDVYLASGNSLYRYQTSGILLTFITFSDIRLNYTDVAVTCGKLLSSYSGSQRGVSVRDLTTLAQSSSFSTSFEIGGLIAGQNNNVYLSSNNYLFNYTLAGIQKQNVAAPQTTLFYGDLTR
ncbi:conserved exported hypothetical protein [Crenothrix polyspora]|uniref:Uncharacterized protein n=1 Tax=Crenothrix polyspora TaxID=360316 RepID=A0A1R4HEF7_9GAMM|nr:hypothetical protein [Crenothrix polyspora]SJM94604.1 conserved exported hypothetical protein [Crenothrix polyspora]